MKKLLWIFICLLWLSFNSCAVSSDPGNLPTGATIESDLGNGWIIFRTDEGRFMYHKQSTGYGGYEGLASLSCK